MKAAVKEAEAELGSDGRILLRQSGTEPLIRVMVEAGTEEICERYVNRLVEVLKENGHLI